MDSHNALLVLVFYPDNEAKVGWDSARDAKQGTYILLLWCFTAYLITDTHIQSILTMLVASLRVHFFVSYSYLTSFSASKNLWIILKSNMQIWCMFLCFLRLPLWLEEYTFWLFLYKCFLFHLLTIIFHRVWWTLKL